MRRYLVVINREIGGDHLREQLRSRLQSEPGQVVLLVTADPSRRIPVGAYDESVRAKYEAEERPGPDHSDFAWEQARRRAGHEAAKLRDLGLAVDGEAGEPDPFEAISRAVERGRFDEVILCGRRQLIGHWLGRDLPRRVEQAFGIPVSRCMDDSPGDAPP